MHHHSFGSVYGDIIGCCQMLELVEGVQKLTEVRVGTVHVNNNDGVINVFPAVACVVQGII